MKPLNINIYKNVCNLKDQTKLDKCLHESLCFEFIFEVIYTYEISYIFMIKKKHRNDNIKKGSTFESDYNMAAGNKGEQIEEEKKDSKRMLYD